MVDYASREKIIFVFVVIGLLLAVPFAFHLFPVDFNEWHWYLPAQIVLSASIPSVIVCSLAVGLDYVLRTDFRKGETK